MTLTFLDILLVALCSAGVTLVTAYTCLKTLLLPKIREEIDRDFENKLNHAIQVMKVEIHNSVKAGVLKAVAEIPTREVIRETTTNMAKTGMGFVGASIDAVLGKKK